MALGEVGEERKLCALQSLLLPASSTLSKILLLSPGFFPSPEPFWLHYSGSLPPSTYCVLQYGSCGVSILQDLMCAAIRILGGGVSVPQYLLCAAMWKLMWSIELRGRYWLNG